MELLKVVEEQYAVKNEWSEFGSGDTITVHYRIVEGNKERIQQFKGIVIQKKGCGISATFTVRKISYGVGVEKTLPVHSPLIDKIEIVREGSVRRAKLNYLRDRLGKSAKVKEKKKF